MKSLLVGGVSSDKLMVWRLLANRDEVMAYTNAGIMILRPSSVGGLFTYGDYYVEGLGVSSGNHVAGDDFIHGCIDLRGDFYTIEPGGRIEKLGYREYISPMLTDVGYSGDYAHDYVGANSHVIVSYYPKDRRFYISDGNTCVIVNRFGAYTAFQRPSSVIQGWNGQLYGTFSESPDQSAVAVLDTQDFGTRDFKNLESVVAGVRCSSGASIEFSTYWRSSASGEFRQSEWKPGGPTGEATIQVASAEMKPAVRISSYEGAELTYLIANIKFTGRKFRRGLAPGTTRGQGAVQL
jgi:hypothetical protein